MFLTVSLHSPPLYSASQAQKRVCVQEDPEDDPIDRREPKKLRVNLISLILLFGFKKVTSSAEIAYFFKLLNVFQYYR